MSRYTNRLEDGAGPGHKIISAGLAPRGADRSAMENRRAALSASLATSDDPADQEAVARVVSALLGAFPVYGIAEGQARATVQMICRALDDVPVWAVKKAAANFLKGPPFLKTNWNPEKAPTPPQIRAEAMMAVLDVETELHRLSQVLDAELVDNDTTEDERAAALAHWAEIRAGIAGTNILHQRTDEELNRERNAQIRANRLVRARERGVQPELAQQIQAGHEPFDAFSRENVQ